MLVVDELEVIDVEHEQRQRPAVAGAAGDLALEELEEVALVVGTRQGIHDRHPVDLLVVAGLDARADQELEDRRADLHEVTVLEDALRDRDVVHIRAVRRLEILHRPVLAGAEDARVAAGDGVAIDLDVAVSATTERDLAARQREPLAHVGARRIDEHETALARFLGRLDDLNLGDAGLPLTHERAPRRIAPQRG